MKRFLCVLFFFVLPIVAICWLLYQCHKNGFFTSGKLKDNMYVSTTSSISSSASQGSSSPDSSTITSSPPVNRPAPSAPPTNTLPLPVHPALVINTAPATITNTHTLSRYKSNPDAVHHVHIQPPQVPKSQSYEMPPRKLSTVPACSSYSNSKHIDTEPQITDNSTLRRKLDITAPRLHATTNPLALTEGAQFIQSGPARCAPTKK